MFLKYKGVKKYAEEEQIFLVYYAECCRKAAPAAVKDVYCSLSVQPEVPHAHGLWFLKSLFGKSVHCDCSLSVWTCTGLVLVCV